MSDSHRHKHVSHQKSSLSLEQRSGHYAHVAGKALTTGGLGDDARDCSGRRAATELAIALCEKQSLADDDVALLLCHDCDRRLRSFLDLCCEQRLARRLADTPERRLLYRVVVQRRKSADGHGPRSKKPRDLRGFERSG